MKQVIFFLQILLPTKMQQKIKRIHGAHVLFCIRFVHFSSYILNPCQFFLAQFDCLPKKRNFLMFIVSAAYFFGNQANPRIIF